MSGIGWAWLWAARVRIEQKRRRYSRALRLQQSATTAGQSNQRWYFRSMVYSCVVRNPTTIALLATSPVRLLAYNPSPEISTKGGNISSHLHVKKVKINGTPSHSYGMSLAIQDHTVLTATRHKWTHPALTPARQAGTRFIYLGGMKGWVDLSGWLHTEMAYLSANSHPSQQ